MKVNTDTVLEGERVKLVPYRREHVPKYHEWMGNERLRTLTASEPLTLEEEYHMQQKWQEDEDKLTFIILDCESNDMVGDVNLFLNSGAGEAEVEIMIAEPAYRRKGLASEALMLMLQYATGDKGFDLSPTLTKVPLSPLNIPTQNLVTRIGDTNLASIRLFKKLGFVITKRVEVFKEVEMRYRRN